MSLSDLGAEPARPWLAETLHRELDGRWATPQLRTETGSTNDDIARFAEDHGISAGAWALVAARYQRAGRGRRGRSWQAADGDAVLFSIATRLQVPAERWPSASLIVGHAVVETLRQLLPADAPRDLLGLRWPNDVLVGKHHLKVGGVLCERIQPPHAATGEALWIAGVGVNLRAPLEPHLTASGTGLLTLLSAEDAARLAPETLIGQLAQGIARHIDAWQLRGGFLLPDLHGESLRFCDGEVGLDLGDGRRVAAWLCGIDRVGALLVRDVVDGAPVGPKRSVIALRVLDARTDPPWHHPPDPAPHPAD